MRRGSRGVSWIFAGAALLWACAGPAHEAPRPSVVHAEPVRLRFELVEAARSWPAAAPPFVSRGHGDGNYAIDIRVSPSSVDAVRNLVLGQTVPVGTAVVAFQSNNRSKVLESVFTMRKLEDGKWEFRVAAPTGELLSEDAPPLCSRCHAEAPADFLFVPAELAAAIGMSPPAGSAESAR